MSNFNYATHNTPVNRNAASAMSGGCSYEVPRPEGFEGADGLPIKTKRHPAPSSDLTGTQYGRMQVVGYVRRNKKTGSIYSCRCRCGRHEVRRSRTIKDKIASGESDMCFDCRHLERLRRRS